MSWRIWNLARQKKQKRGAEKVDQKQITHRKSIDTFGQRTSQYRGVTRHRWTGRYEAHLWDNSCKTEGQSRKGRQVYLGGYDMEEKAARAYDQAALKYWGPSTHINFSLENYQQELEQMKNMTRQEYVAPLRRDLEGNKLTGQIPDEIGNCASLVHLDLSENLLYGDIPFSISKLKRLEFLHRI